MKKKKKLTGPDFSKSQYKILIFFVFNVFEGYAEGLAPAPLLREALFVLTSQRARH